MERKIILSGETEWVPVHVPKREGKLADGTYVETGDYMIHVATRCPVYEDGAPVVLKHRDAPQFFRQQNEAYGLSGNEALRWSYGFEDKAIIELITPEHKMFNTRAYFGDFTEPWHDLKMVEGIGQQLVQRLYYLRTLDDNIRIGPVTAAQGGMIPRFTKDEFEGIIGAQGLDKLAKLRGCEIAPHNSHFYPPSQNASETVGVRDAGWLRHGWHWCFGVVLDACPDCSLFGGSVPLVRGEARIKIGRTFL